MTEMIITYFVAINVFTLIVSIIDKGFAVYKKRRVPENLLLALSFSGGAVGAKIAQIISGHKTLKLEFTVSLNLIAFLQLGMAAAVWSQQLHQDGIVVREVLLASFEKEEEMKPAIPRRFGPGS